MYFQILKYLVAAIFIFSRLSHQQTTPEERCLMQFGGSVCVDCSRTGRCAYIDGTFVVEDITPCTTDTQTYCDDTLFGVGFWGTCSPLPEGSTNCSCSSISECIADVNNPAVVLHCESDPPVSDPACSVPALDLTTCGCLSCSDETVCPLVDDPNDDCRRYFLCDGRDLTQFSCSSGLCFDQASCGCVESGGLTSVAPTPDPNCPLIDDPNDDCASYFVLNGNVLIPLSCSEGLCFNQADCACEEQGPTAAPTTATDTTSNCPFVDDPNNDCGSYFIFDGTELIPTSCPGTQCFNQTRCGCFNNGGSSQTTSTTTTSSATIVTQRTTSSSITCPAGCPFADDPDPNAVCGSFYICSGQDGQDLVKAVCPGILCFNQASCQCE